MGARKRLAADARKEALKTQSFAKLNGVPTVFRHRPARCA